jgi:hypothetical protein
MKSSEREEMIRAGSDDTKQIALRGDLRLHHGNSATEHKAENRAWRTTDWSL